MYDYLVVGAGFFGSVFAYEASKRGKKVLVIDKRANIGGNCFTQNQNGINIHKFGAHIFHTSDERVYSFICDLCDMRDFSHSVVANFKGKIYNLPFNMNTFAQIWGVARPDEARKIIANQKAQIKNEPQNLEEQAISLVGRDIYERLIKGYTHKQWGRACDKLPPSIIKRLPVRFSYDNNYFNDKFQGIPKGGYTGIFDRLLAKCELRLNTDFLRERTHLQGLARKIIFTGAIDAYFDYKFGALEYRSLKFEEKWLQSPNFQGTAVMNFTDFDTPYTRIIEHKFFDLDDFSLANGENTVISYEFPQKYEPGENEAYYPINDAQNSTLYAKYEELAVRENGVIFGGRLGEYKYYDMDKVIKRALEACEREFGV